jgi:hypothetical protein
MLIVNDEQRLRAGIGSLSKRCQYCSKALAAYPLILSDDGRLAVYHAACAAALATEILVDLYTFLSPPAPYQQLFVLTTFSAAPPQQTSVQREEPVRDAPRRASKGVTDAINEYSPDQGGATGSSLPGHDAGQLSPGASGCHQEEEGAAPGDDPRVGPLVRYGECAH